MLKLFNNIVSSLFGGSLDKDNEEEANLDFLSVEAEDVMIQRSHMGYVLSREIIDDIPANKLEEHNILPVCSDSLDNVQGYITSNIVLLANISKEKKIEIGSIMKKNILFFSSSTKLRHILFEMDKKKSECAIVLDEFGGSKGFITNNAIIKFLVNEYCFDINILPNEKGELELEGLTSLEDLKEIILDFYKKNSSPIFCSNFLICLQNFIEETHTVSGFVCSYLERIPNKGDIIEIYESKIEILEATPKLIQKMKIYFPINK